MGGKTMILAPMQGLTEVLFRRVYEECFPHTFNYAVSPFISLTHGNLADAWEKIDDVLPENNIGSIPVVPQILGREVPEFIDMANRLYDLGYNEINWNMGCPMRRVAAKHRGSGILPHPDEVAAILDAVLPHIKPSFSIKMRLGLSSTDDIFTLIPLLNSYPIASVTIHPRLGRQQYNGTPDLATFARILPLFKHPVIYNGDICTPADAEKIFNLFPSVNDVMIGRGVLYRPTLPSEILGIDIDDCAAASRNFVLRLLDAVDATMPTNEAKIRKTKEYWCLLWKSLNITEIKARTVLHANELCEIKKIIADCIQ